MALTSKWRIEGLERDVATGRVLTVHWRCLASDGDLVVERYGAVPLWGEIPIPYDELTVDVVIGWVKRQLGVDALQAMEQAMAADLAALKQPPTVVSPPPWEARADTAANTAATTAATAGSPGALSSGGARRSAAPRRAA